MSRPVEAGDVGPRFDAGQGGGLVPHPGSG